MAKAFVNADLRAVGDKSQLHYLKLGLGGAQIEVNQRLMYVSA
jgi:hypothetical protein